MLTSTEALGVALIAGTHSHRRSGPATAHKVSCQGTRCEGVWRDVRACDYVHVHEANEQGERRGGLVGAKGGGRERNEREKERGGGAG
jgi:hypothetical protein